MAATFAVQSHEPMGEHAALEISTKLSFDEPRDGCLLLPCVHEEGFELFSHDLVKKGFFGLMAFVFDRACLAGTAGAIEEQQVRGRLRGAMEFR